MPVVLEFGPKNRHQRCLSTEPCSQAGRIKVYQPKLQQNYAGRLNPDFLQMVKRSVRSPSFFLRVLSQMQVREQKIVSRTSSVSPTNIYCSCIFASALYPQHQVLKQRDWDLHRTWVIIPKCQAYAPKLIKSPIGAVRPSCKNGYCLYSVSRQA